jgi:CBS domain-containing protein
MIKNVGELLKTLYKKGKRKDVLCIDDTATAQEAAALMTQNGIRFLGVTHTNRKGVRKRVGVISNTDTSSEFGASLRPSERLVSAIMTKPAVTVHLDDEIPLAVRVCTEKKIGHVVVVDGIGRWRAVLSYDQAVKALMDNLAEEEQLEALKQSGFPTT